MIQFKPIELGDREQIEKYLKKSKFNTYEYSFSTLYLWRKYCDIEYAIINDALIIKKNTERNGEYFMQPLGCSDEGLKDIIKILQQCKEKGKANNYLFGDIEKCFAEELQRSLKGDCKVIEDEDNFDYIYNADELIQLPGKKFHDKKNLYNQFVKKYDYSIAEISDEKTIADAIQFAKSWYDSSKQKSEELEYELEAIIDVLNNFKYLNLFGIIVYVEGAPAAISIGERTDNDMGIIHVEKADSQYKGIYAFTNKTFAEKFLKDVTYINREEDLGVEGLRKAKLSYNPVKTELKYLIKV